MTPPNLRGVMTRRMHRVFPQLRDVGIEYLWGGMIDISLNRAPHWGRLSPNLYFAQGFSGHGLIAAGLAGTVMAEAIRGQSERLDLFAKIATTRSPAAAPCARRCWWPPWPGTSCATRSGRRRAACVFSVTQLSSPDRGGR